MQDAVIYTRVSSREQEQEGFSLDSQAKLLREYALRNGLRIIQAFEDVETAKAAGRKQFGKLVDFFKRNRSCRVLLVEKTDRISRNFRDAVTLEDLDIEVHFVKEGQIISKDSKSQATLIYGFNLVMARHYSNNLREEVKKGQREKALQGTYPGHAPFGYRNNKAERTIEVDPEDSPIVTRIFELYATGAHSLTTLSRAIRLETGKRVSRGNVHLILRNRFYLGSFEWSGHSYCGTHPLFVNPQVFEHVQAVLSGHNRPKYSKRDIAFRGLMTCAYDDCMVTGEIQKAKYVYYRCTGHRGKCDLPRFREEDIANRLGEPLKGLQVPSEIVSQIVTTLREDQKQAAGKVSVERTRLETRLSGIHSHMDAAYVDKLDGKIPEEFWERKMSEWRLNEQQVKMAIQGLKNAETGDRALDAQRILELANQAHSLYISQTPAEKAKLLRLMFSNFSIDAVNITPTYRKPFDIIFKRAQKEEWSGREDSNLRPPGPEPGALPDCATPRKSAAVRCRWEGFPCSSSARVGLLDRCTDLKSLADSGRRVIGAKKDGKEP
jgi:site-specific DNA recombinase